MHPSPATASAAQRGLTLVELCVVVAVLGVLVGLAAPAFRSAIERRHLEGTAAQLETDIHFARSLAAARNESLRLSFSSADGASCYVVHTGPAGACRCNAAGEAACEGEAQAVRALRLAADDPVRIDANAASMLFDAAKGTSTPTATLRVTSRSVGAIHLVVNVMGRVRSCSPERQVPGLPRC